ncbi:hypothetical protein DMC30DRAFT_448571 [Rhodotorula diobovata]|uniref:Ricin B lectin domain-containing protein n=1 Tax=Rhodotorula diobovata TaxID=5288 RepID=A0A5C5FSG1_9BASI|nr:hypothetical protein DMC30DRAFT_448571 [Rhodotorula diobovata]
MRSSPIHLLLCALLALFLAVEAKKTGKVLTTNEKQAAAIQAAAVKLKPGKYKFTNVQTGQLLYYVAKGNHIYPTKGKTTPATVSAYSNSKVPWHRLQFGSKNKCLSSAWVSGKTQNSEAVMYVCASGKGAQKTTLEKTKQWWLFVPVSKPTVAASSKSYANTVLLAAQADSIATREKKIAAQKAAFSRRSTGMVRHVRRHALEKRGIKTVVGGTFYIIPTDHLLDRTAALTGKTVKRAGIKSTAIADWKKGNKAQQWKVTRVK